MIRLAPLAFILLAGPAIAAERTVALGSFDRVRIEGAYQVTIATGRSPDATLSGERDALDEVDVRLDGTTLVVRRAATRWASRTAPTQPVAVTLATPNLVAASVVGGSTLHVARMKGDRIDLSLGGAGSIAVDAVDAGRAQVTLIGAGSVSLAGKATAARLLTSGSGSIDAGKLDAGELVVRLDGAGETSAAARYTAQVTNTGLGRVTVAGSPQCRVTATAGGPVVCGTR